MSDRDFLVIGASGQVGGFLLRELERRDVSHARHLS
jgi:uncharacterized protein YbjT (DUF2867 family)